MSALAKMKQDGIELKWIEANKQILPLNHELVERLNTLGRISPAESDPDTQWLVELSAAGSRHMPERRREMTLIHADINPATVPRTPLTPVVPSGSGGTVTPRPPSGSGGTATPRPPSAVLPSTPGSPRERGRPPVPTCRGTPPPPSAKVGMRDAVPPPRTPGLRDAMPVSWISDAAPPPIRLTIDGLAPRSPIPAFAKPSATKSSHAVPSDNLVTVAELQRSKASAPPLPLRAHVAPPSPVPGRQPDTPIEALQAAAAANSAAGRQPHTPIEAYGVSAASSAASAHSAPR